MESLKEFGVTAIPLGPIAGVSQWKIKGNTSQFHPQLAASGGFWQKDHWRLTDTQFKSFLKRVAKTPHTKLATKRQKTENTQELKQRKQEWELAMASDSSDAYCFIMDKVFNLFLQRKGETCWGSFKQASDAVHACGLNIVWELFVAADKDIDKVLGKDHQKCYGCGESYT